MLWGCFRAALVWRLALIPWTSENPVGAKFKEDIHDEPPRTMRSEIRATAARYHDAKAIGQREAKERWIS